MGPRLCSQPQVPVLPSGSACGILSLFSMPLGITSLPSGSAHLPSLSTIPIYCSFSASWAVKLLLPPVLAVSLTCSASFITSNVVRFASSSAKLFQKGT